MCGVDVESQIVKLLEAEGRKVGARAGRQEEWEGDGRGVQSCSQCKINGF